MSLQPSVPFNSEHHEASQEETNRIRNKLFENQSPKIKANQKMIEKIVSQLEEANLPFILLVNPSGYTFDENATEPTPNGFWQYHKFHGEFPPYSEGANKNVLACKKNGQASLLSFASFVFPNYKVVVFDENDKATHISFNGKIGIIPQQENE